MTDFHMKKTKRVLNEKELLRVAALLDTNEDPIFVHDEESGIIYWNNGASSTYGFTREEALGCLPQSLLSTCFPLLREDLIKILKAEGRWEGQLTQTTKSGMSLIVSSRWNMHSDGTILEVNRDITRLIEKEKELEDLTEELTRSNTDLQQFAYAISHDLQEPLRAVAGFLDLLKMKTEGRLDESELNYIALASDGAARMRLLIGDLLQFSKLDSSAELLESSVDLNEVMKIVKQNLAELIAETSAELIIRSELPNVKGNQNQIIQLLQNLVSNSIKYRSASRTPLIEVTFALSEHEVQLCVEDNGIGFDEAYSERIFQIFQRLHATGKYSGTGIGLALCKRIIERHQGKIWCRSKIDEGSQFFVCLPRFFLKRERPVS